VHEKAAERRLFFDAGVNLSVIPAQAGIQ